MTIYDGPGHRKRSLAPGPNLFSNPRTFSPAGVSASPTPSPRPQPRGVLRHGRLPLGSPDAAQVPPQDQPRRGQRAGPEEEPDGTLGRVPRAAGRADPGTVEAGLRLPPRAAPEGR